MNITVRITALVVIGFLVSVIIGGTAIRHMSDVGGGLAAVVERDLPLIHSLTEAVMAQTEYGLRIEQSLEAAVAGRANPPEIREPRAIGNALRKAAALARMLPRKSDPELVDAARSIAWLVTAQNQYADTLERFDHLVTTGRVDAARALIPEITGQRERIVAEIDELLLDLEHRATAAAENARADHAAGMSQTVLVWALGLAISLLIGLAVGRSVTVPLGRVTDSLRRLRRGDTAEDLALPGAGSEIAAIVEAVNAFRAEIVDHRHTVSALTESEKRFHTLAALAPVGVFFTDLDGHCRYVNDAWCDITGLARHDAMGAPWTATIDAGDFEQVGREWAECMHANRPFAAEFRFRRPDGGISWVIGQGAAQSGLDGVIEGYVGTITDITRRRLDEEALRHREQVRAELHGIATDQTLSLDAKVGRVLELGRRVFDLPLGIVSRIEGERYEVLHIRAPEGGPSPGTLFPLGDTYCVHTLNANGPIAFHHAGSSAIATHPCYRKFRLEAYIGAPIVVDGRPFGTLNFSGPKPRLHPFTDPDLSIVHHFADWIGHEIARNKANAARRESAQRLQTVFETVIDGIITIDAGGRIESVNPAAERIFGYETGGLVGRNVNILMPEPHAAKHGDYLARYLESGEARIIGATREVEAIRRDGTVIPVELAINETRIGERLLFTGSVRDITERKRIERLKDEFVSSVSHELRTPLTSIRGALGLILGGAAGALQDKTVDLLRIAHGNSERLIALVNDILDLQKIESGRLEFRFQTLAPRAVIEAAIEANRGLAQELGVTLTVVEPVVETEVQGDPARLAQVMANLLSNAVKFSSRGGTVRVSAQRHQARIRFRVADDGPGIPEDFRPRVFERFAQADSSDTRRVGGTGLGLSIAKGIVERHGGGIGFETEVGVGTTFFFDLPDHHALAAERPAADGPGTNKGRILVCEDDPDVAHLLAMMLEQDGYATAVAHDTRTAKSLLHLGGFDAMTVDILLPDGNGVDLMRELRDDAATRDLAMVVVSAKAHETRNSLDDVGLGVLDWLNKPIDEDRLLAAVARATRLSGRHRPQLLYVENDRDLTRVMETLLEDTADLAVADSLAAATAILEKRRFDLVLLDIGLPDGSGLDLLPLIKDDSARPTPVIVFSGHEIEGTMSELVESALVKSRTSNEVLLRTIKRFIGVGKQRRKETSR